jgi:hypothetical protein
MPIKCPSGKKARFRFKKGTKTRLAFCNGKVMEAKDFRSGKVHTQKEFERDRRGRGGRR